MTFYFIFFIYLFKLVIFLRDVTNYELELTKMKGNNHEE